MRRFIAYVVMMLTMLSVLVFNTQSVLEGSTNAMEYGKATKLTYALTNRDISVYPNTNYPDLNASGITDLDDDNDIKSKIMSRLEDAGVRNADVELVKGTSNEGYKINVSFTPLSETEKSNVRTLLEFEGVLAIGTVGDDTVYYENSGENGTIFESDGDDVAELVYSGTTPYPAIIINDTTKMDDLITAAKNAAEAHKGDTETESSASTSSSSIAESASRQYFADGDGSEEEETDPNETRLILWNNKTSDDTYDKAYGMNGEYVDEAVKSKVICELDTSNYSADNKLITITSDLEGNAFTVSTARALVNALNSDDYGFDIEYLYENSVYSAFGTSALSRTYYVFLGVLLVIAILLIVMYGYSGVTAGLNMMVSTMVSLLLFNLLGFEFSVAGLVGLIVTSVLSVMMSSNYFEKVKQEMKLGRSPEKANREGYRKGFFGALDLSLVAFAGSLFSFLISTGSYKTFFGAIMIGTVFTFIITNFMDKWMTYWLVKGAEENDKPYFGFKRKEKEPKKFVSEKKSANVKKMSFVAVIAALIVGVSLPLTNALSKQSYGFFNGSDAYSTGYMLNITFNDDSQSYTPLDSKTNYISYLEKIGSENQYYKFEMVEKGSSQKDTSLPKVTYDNDSITVNIVEKLDDEQNTYFIHYFTVAIEEDINEKGSSGYSVLSAIEETMNDRVSITLDDNTTINPVQDTHYQTDSLEVTCLATEPADKEYDTNNLLLLIFLVAVFAAIYILLRYGLNLFLTFVATGTIEAGLAVGLLSLTRLSYTPYVGFALLALTLITGLILLPLLSDNKAVIKEKGLKNNCTEEQHAEIENQTANRALPTILITLISTILLFVSFFFVNSSLLSTSLMAIILAVVSIFVSYLFGLNFYHFLVTHIHFTKIKNFFYNRKEESDEKKKDGQNNIRYVDEDGPHETIIPGMNDFH